MKVTKVIYDKGCAKSLTCCSAVIDNVFKINGIRLYQKQDKYFLVFPSKQDVFKEVIDLNNQDLILPDDAFRLNDLGEKVYDEYFFPVSSEFYEYLLKTILTGYPEWVEQGKQRKVFRPEK